MRRKTKTRRKKEYGRQGTIISKEGRLLWGGGNQYKNEDEAEEREVIKRPRKKIEEVRVQKSI